MKLRQINKRGSSFEGWTEGMVLSILFVIIFGVVVIGGMNTLHDGDNEVVGFDTDNIQDELTDYRQNQQTNIEGGTTSFTAVVGLVLGTSWDIILGLLSLLMYFVGGGWLSTLASYLMFPDIVGTLLQTLWVISLGFIILRMLFNKRRI